MSIKDASSTADLISRWADKAPDRDVLTFEGADVRPDEIRTYADLWQNANKMAAGLVARGVQPGDRIAVLMRNHPEFVELMIAVSITGCLLVPIDVRTKGAKLSYMLNDSGSSGVLVADYALAQLEEIRSEVPGLKWVWVLESREEPNQPLASDVKDATPLAEILDSSKAWIDIRSKPGNPLEILYTSGTTGDPKGVVIGGYFRPAWQADLYGFTDAERPYTGLSLTHGNAQGVTLGPALAIGQRAVFSRRFTKSRLWDVIRKYHCTMFSMLGGMATAIYSEPEKPDDADNPIQVLISAGMPAAIWEAFEKRFNLRILEFYGAMEGGFTSKPIGEGPIGSMGKPRSDLKMKIVDENGEECPPGVTGEIICRPANGEPAKVVYWNNPSASAKKSEGGWIHSGDMAHRDADGWFFFDYRKGDGIRRNGDFVNTSFVERALAEEDQVNDVFVYGVPAASGAPGEKDVVAAVVPVNAQTFDPTAIFAYCGRKLEPNFIPSYLQVLSEIPKTASEKPQPRFLIQGLKDENATIYTPRSKKAVKLSAEEIRTLAARL